MPVDLSHEPAAPAATAAPARRHAWSWWREPLLHFVLLGGALFALDAAINRNLPDYRVITVDETVDREAVQVFKEARGRAPNDDELYALRRVWLDNEVLYREGLALQMDKGDKTIKDRVIFKALSMINAGLKLPPIDDAGLRAWFEKNRAKYDEPARYDFHEAVLAGDQGEAAARALAALLNNPAAAGAGADTSAGLRVFKGRPLASIVESYGKDFAGSLAALPVGEWRALPHRGSWRVLRMDAVSAPKAADYEALRNAVAQDWTDAVMAEQRSAAVRQLARKYTVRVEAARP